MHTLTIIREAMEQGRKACAAMKSIYDNPYRPMTENLQNIAWEKGYMEQQSAR